MDVVGILCYRCPFHVNLRTQWYTMRWPMAVTWMISGIWLFLECISYMSITSIFQNTALHHALPSCCDRDGIRNMVEIECTLLLSVSCVLQNTALHYAAVNGCERENIRNMVIFGL